jgi:trehalose synthase
MLEESRIDAGTTLVTQVSRWDGLKDPVGVLRCFAEYISPGCAIHLMLAGPATAAVSDDPEGAATFQQVVATWRELATEPRSRVHLASLPMQDGEENAVIVNAVQRRSQIVVQKSLAEGFGLTVAEAMWKARPVVASRIGGIQDQIDDGVTGILVDDPHDLRSFGAAVRSLVDDPARAGAMGEAAQLRVRDNFLGARSLMSYVDLLAGLAGRPRD